MALPELRRPAALLAAVAPLFLLATLLAACSSNDDNDDDNPPGPGSSAEQPIDIGAVTDQVLPSVFRVGVACQDGPATCQGGGSGWLFDAEGHLITNNHVVTLGNQAPPAEEVLITALDGTTFRARVIGGDPLSDIAVLEADLPDDYEPLDLAGTPARLGEWVVAVGYALGLGGAPSVTVGVISAEDRIVQEAAIGFYGAIQTDAAINPGNSGGPLVNLDGNVVGVNSSGIQQAQGIGFAINAETVEGVAGAIIERGGDIERGFIGVSFQAVTPQIAERLDLDGADGVVIVQVVPRSPADEAGIEPEDVIVRIGDRDIEQSSDLPLALISYPPGETVEIALIRDGEEETVEVTLAESPQP